MFDDPLWSSIRGAGSPTVMFEAGGGENSSVWSELEAEVRDRYEVRTMLYDRAGLGRSPLSSPPYRIDREAEVLRREFDRHGVTAPVVLVAHSYGAFVATIVAATDSRIAGSSSSTPTSRASSTTLRLSACSRRTGRSSLLASVPEPRIAAWASVRDVTRPVLAPRIRSTPRRQPSVRPRMP